MRPPYVLSAWIALAVSVAGAVPAAAMDFALFPVGGDAVVLRLSGRIVEGDTDRLSAFVKSVPPASKIAGLLLASQGGQLSEASRMTRAVGRAGWKAAVASGDTCASACVLLYAAASARFAAPGAEIGVHSANEGGQDTIAARAATVDMARIANGLGVPAEIIVRMVGTQPSTVAWLTPRELDLWHVTVGGNGQDVIALLAPPPAAAPAVARPPAAVAQPAGATTGTAEAALATTAPAAAAIRSAKRGLPATAARAAPQGASVPAGTPPAWRQRAVLTAPSGEAPADAAESGTVTWSFVESIRDGAEVVADAVIPDRALSLQLTLRQNRDPSLPASHMIDVRITTPADFAGGGITHVELASKAAADADADPLVGVSAAVQPGVYWIALSGTDRDLAANLALLKRGLIEVRLTYADGGQAVLTLEKGEAGAEVLTLAVAAWHLG